MQRTALFLLPLLVLLAACSKRICNDPNTPRRVYTKNFYQFNNSKIDTISGSNGVSYRKALNGNKTVFEYEYNSDIPNSYDAGYSSSLVFQADSGLAFFNYTDEDLKNHLTYYEGYGAWGGYGQEAVTRGFIKGEKIDDNTWRIDINVQLARSDDYADIKNIVESTTFTVFR